MAKINNASFVDTCPSCVAAGIRLMKGRRGSTREHILQSINRPTIDSEGKFVQTSIDEYVVNGFVFDIFNNKNAVIDKNIFSSKVKKKRLLSSMAYLKTIYQCNGTYDYHALP